jgi:hypothetical protein
LIIDRFVVLAIQRLGGSEQKRGREKWQMPRYPQHHIFLVTAKNYESFLPTVQKI